MWTKIIEILKRIFKQNKNYKIMSELKEFDDRHVDTPDERTSAGINYLSQNKTLYIGQFQQSVYNPELLVEAKTINDVINKFQPNVEISFRDENRDEVTETIEIEKIEDFEVNKGKGNLVQKSSHLKNIKAEIETAGKMEKNITEDRALRDVLRKDEDKENLKMALQAMLDELNSTIK